MEKRYTCEDCGEAFWAEPSAAEVRDEDGEPLFICADCQIERLLVFEAEVREKEERKFELLYRLQSLPADDPLWDEIARRMG